MDYVTRGDAGNEEVVFSSRGSAAQTEKILSKSHIFTRLGGNPISLICTNISSMMGGNANMWKSGAGKPSGLVNPANNRPYSLMELGLNEP